MLIDCACKCGLSLEKFDKKNRPRKYIHGHNKSRLGKKLSKETIHKIKIARAKQTFSTETKRKMSLSKKGKKNHFWNGGSYKTVNGYVFIYKPNHPFANNDGYVYEHRLVMEKHLERYLTKQEVVHHANGKKHDNRIENLKLFPNNSDHIKYAHT